MSPSYDVPRLAKAKSMLLCLVAVPVSLPAAEASSGPLVADGLVPGQVVVVYGGAIPEEALGGLSALGSVVAADPVLAYAIVGVPAGFESAAIAAASSLPGVSYAYQARERSARFVPSDPLYPNQWASPALGLEAAWDTTLGSHDVKVAIVDTGLDYLHPDLQANTFLADPLCGVDRDFTKYLPLEDGEHQPAVPVPLPVPLAIDDHGHGTAVGGIVAAVTDNDRGVAGVSQSCLLGVKVLNQWGSGTGAQVASGIRWSADMGADVISMSIGGFVNDPLEQAAVQYAAARGIVLVAAAGNAFCPNPGSSNTVEFPARYPEVIAVSALDPPGLTTSSFSSCGPKVEIAAPGEDVATTQLTGVSVLLGVERYNLDFRGTSAATPFVSGVAALMLDANPDLSGLQARCVLAATADDLGPVGRDPQFGFGRLDADEAVAAALDPGSVGC